MRARRPVAILERSPTAAGPRRRRRLWRRRPDQVDLHVRLLRIEDLFQAPELDPFREDHAGYDERPGVEQMLSALRMAKRRARATATIAVPGEGVPPDLEERTRSAMARYCRRKLALLDEELHEVRRFGVQALLWGFLAVIVLNAIASGIQDDFDPLAQGLQVASWVILWVPVNLLVYDRWYYRRDQRGYRTLLEMPIRIVGGGEGARSEGRAWDA